MPVDLSTLRRPPVEPPTALETAQAECFHTNLQPTFNVQAVRDETEPTLALGFLGILQLACVDCGLRFKWLGCPTGQSFSRPMVSDDGFALRAPLVPGNETVQDASGLPEIRELSEQQRAEVTTEILAALMVPENYTPKLLAETRTEHRARAIFAALERMAR